MIILLLSIIILEILLFALIKNKIVKYIGILISVILNIIPKEYPFGYQLILNLVITIIAIIFLIRQKYLIEKEKGIYTNYESSLGLRVICFLIPLVGLIIYAVNIVQNPKIAKECGKVSLIGFIIGLVISLATTFIIIYG
ncbi:MAG: hypothetical protein ACLUWN_07275 [Clostridia bacterium]|jgi:hypothetical protein